MDTATKNQMAEGRTKILLAALKFTAELDSSDFAPACQFERVIAAPVTRPERIIDPRTDSPEAKALTPAECYEMGLWACDRGSGGASSAVCVGGMVFSLCSAHYRAMARYHYEKRQRLAYQRRKDIIAAHALIGNSRKYKNGERGRCKKCGPVDLVWAFGWHCPNREKALAGLDSQ